MAGPFSWLRSIARERRRRSSPEDEPRSDDPYRERVPNVEQLLRDVEAEHAALRHRVRVLERQLLMRGEAPMPTPRGADLLRVAQVLHTLAGREGRLSLNTLEYSYLARVVESLAVYIEGD